jgi:DNA repair ATPase RecN
MEERIRNIQIDPFKDISHNVFYGVYEYLSYQYLSGLLVAYSKKRDLENVNKCIEAISNTVMELEKLKFFPPETMDSIKSQIEHVKKLAEKHRFKAIVEYLTETVAQFYEYDAFEDFLRRIYENAKEVIIKKIQQ